MAKGEHDKVYIVIKTLRRYFQTNTTSSYIISNQCTKTNANPKDVTKINEELFFTCFKMT